MPSWIVRWGWGGCASAFEPSTKTPSPMLLSLLPPLEGWDTVAQFLGDNLLLVLMVFQSNDCFLGICIIGSILVRWPLKLTTEWKTTGCMWLLTLSARTFTWWSEEIRYYKGPIYIDLKFSIISWDSWNIMQSSWWISCIFLLDVELLYLFTFYFNRDWQSFNIIISDYQ